MYAPTLVDYRLCIIARCIHDLVSCYSFVVRKISLPPCRYCFFVFDLSSAIVLSVDHHRERIHLSFDTSRCAKLKIESMLVSSFCLCLSRRMFYRVWTVGVPVDVQLKSALTVIVVLTVCDSFLCKYGTAVIMLSFS